jgi:hypothetical protein
MKEQHRAARGPVVEVSFEGTTPETKHLQFTARWALVGRRWECVGVGVDLVHGVDHYPHHIRRQDVDLIRMSEVLERGTELLSHRLEEALDNTAKGERQLIEPLMGDYPQEWAESQRAEAEELQAAVPKRVGRPRRVSPSELEEVARIYKSAQQRGDHPTKAVQEELGLSRAVAVRRVWMCRRDELLPKTQQGFESAKEES